MCLCVQCATMYQITILGTTTKQENIITRNLHHPAPHIARQHQRTRITNSLTPSILPERLNRRPSNLSLPTRNRHFFTHTHTLTRTRINTYLERRLTARCFHLVVAGNTFLELHLKKYWKLLTYQPALLFSTVHTSCNLTGLRRVLVWRLPSDYLPSIDPAVAISVIRAKFLKVKRAQTLNLQQVVSPSTPRRIWFQRHTEPGVINI